MFERFAYGWRDENIPLLIFFFTYLTKVKLKIYKSRDKALASHSRQYFSCLRSRKLRSFSFAICMVNFIFPTLSMLLRKFRKSSRVLILCVQTEKTPSLKRFQTVGLQKQPPEVFYINRCSSKFRKIYRKTPAPEYLF